MTVKLQQIEFMLQFAYHTLQPSIFVAPPSVGCCQQIADCLSQTLAGLMGIQIQLDNPLKLSMVP